MRFSPGNIGSFFASAVAAQVAAAMSGLLLVRWMTVEDYALYTIAVTILGAITLLTRGGVRQGLAAVLAKVWPSRTAAAEAVDAALRVRLAVSALTMPPILGLAWLMLHRAGAPTHLNLACLALLAVIWLADTYGAVIDQVLFFDRKAVRVQALDSVSAWLRLALIFVLRVAGAVSMLTALVTSLIQTAIKVPFVRRWIAETLRQDRRRAPDATVHAVRAVAFRQIPVDVFVVLQAQATIFYLTWRGSNIELATFGALSRIAQLLVPFNAMVLAYLVPRFAKVSEGVGLQIAGYVLIGAVPGLGLLAVALVSPQALLFFIGPAYADQVWALRVCAGMVAFTSAVEIALALVSHRGWNHRGLVRIVFGLVWIAAAPGFVPVHTAAGGFILVCGYSVGTLVSVLLELRAAQRRGEIQLGQAIHQGG